MDLTQLNLNFPESLSLVTFLINLGIGVVLAAGVKWHLWTFGSTLSNREELGRVLPLLLLTTLLVITVVKSSLALSLGLVGALSIVRFRTPIKEPEELAYLFLAIAIGLGLGANQTRLTVAATIAILGVMALWGVVNRKKQSYGRYLHVHIRIEWKEKDEAVETLKYLKETFAQYMTVVDMRRVDTNSKVMEVTYVVELIGVDSLNELLDVIKTDLPDIDVTVMDNTRIPAL